MTECLKLTRWNWIVSFGVLRNVCDNSQIACVFLGRVSRWQICTRKPEWARRITRLFWSAVSWPTRSDDQENRRKLLMPSCILLRICRSSSLVQRYLSTAVAMQCVLAKRLWNGRSFLTIFSIIRVLFPFDSVMCCSVVSLEWIFRAHPEVTCESASVTATGWYLSIFLTRENAFRLPRSSFGSSVVWWLRMLFQSLILFVLILSCSIQISLCESAV